MHHHEILPAILAIPTLAFTVTMFVLWVRESRRAGEAYVAEHPED